jgi:hypothetical protein
MGTMPMTAGTGGMNNHFKKRINRRQDSSASQQIAIIHVVTQDLAAQDSQAIVCLMLPGVTHLSHSPAQKSWVTTQTHRTLIYVVIMSSGQAGPVETLSMLRERGAEEGDLASVSSQHLNIRMHEDTVMIRVIISSQPTPPALHTA